MEKSSKIDLLGLQTQVDLWIKTYGVRYFDIQTNGLLLCEEVGEVARIIARNQGEQSAKLTDNKDLGQELCDVLFVLACIANQSNIDLSKEMEKNFEKKTLRDAQRHKENPKLHKS